MGNHIPVEPVLEITALNNCFIANFRHPYNFRGEFHPFWEMVYATEDHFRVAGDEKVYTMRKGDIIFHKPMEFHRLWSVEHQDIHAFIVGFCAQGQILSQLENGAFILNEQQQRELEEIASYAAAVFPRAEHHGMENYLRTMMDQWEEKAVEVQIFVNRFELFLLSLTRDTVPLTVKELSDSPDSRIYRQTVRLLTENINGWITVDEIAQTLHYSPSRIKRTFAKYSDIGIHKYLLKLKTAEAIRMLQRGVVCSEISRSLGFVNQNYFSTVFKRETGVSPSRYCESAEQFVR